MVLQWRIEEFQRWEVRSSSASDGKKGPNFNFNIQRLFPTSSFTY